jgi:SLT domain-containing protein
MQTVIITATTTKAKVSAMAANPLNNLAAAYTALNAQALTAIERFLSSFFIGFSSIHR